MLEYQAIICRNTTEALNHLAYRLRLDPGDVVVTTVVEHHANLLPWARVATRRYVECGPDGTFGVDDVEAALDETPRPRLLAVTGASNITGWLPPLDAILDAAHRRAIPVVVDAAQLAPHRPLPAGARSTSSTSTRWSGPTRPIAKRQAPRTSSARSLCTARSTLSASSAGRRSSLWNGWMTTTEPKDSGVLDARVL